MTSSKALDNLLQSLRQNRCSLKLSIPAKNSKQNESFLGMTQLIVTNERFALNYNTNEKIWLYQIHVEERDSKPWLENKVYQDAFDRVKQIMAKKFCWPIQINCSHLISIASKRVLGMIVSQKRPATCHLLSKPTRALHK